MSLENATTFSCMRVAKLFAMHSWHPIETKTVFPLFVLVRFPPVSTRPDMSVRTQLLSLTRSQIQPPLPRITAIKRSYSQIVCQNDPSLLLGNRLPHFRSALTASQQRLHFSTAPVVRQTPRIPPSVSPDESASSLRTARTRLASQLAEAQHALVELQKQIVLLRASLPARSRSSSVLLSLLAAITAVLAAYQLSPSFRTVVLATERCGRIGIAVVQCIIDYKILFRTAWDGSVERHEAYEACHEKCAIRIREVLKINGGIYIKLGQHLSSIALIPPAWSRAMVPLQDSCIPTPLEGVESLFLDDMGAPLSTFFSSFDPNPYVVLVNVVIKATISDLILLMEQNRSC